MKCATKYMLKKAAEEAEVGWEFGASKGIAYFHAENMVVARDDQIKAANKVIAKSRSIKKSAQVPIKKVLNNRGKKLLGIGNK